MEDRTADLLGLADVHRWGVIKTTRHQNVAEHSFNVAIIAVEIATQLGQQGNFFVSTDLMNSIMWWSLIHDAPEVLTGDIDGKFKRVLPRITKAAMVEAEQEHFQWMPQPMPEAKVIVKVADVLESILFLRSWMTGERAACVEDELLQLVLPEAVTAAARLGVGTHLGMHQIANNILDCVSRENQTVQFRLRRER